jgi:perosamine synthetase
MDMNKAEEILRKTACGEYVPGVPEKHNGFKAMIPVHFGGQAVDIEHAGKLCSEYGLYLIEDCAHCCPAYYKTENGEWKMTGSSADIACYSFYANKTITTGEGGMALTDNPEWADRMRIMSLHGISKDAWKRFSKEGSWYYEITAPGYKYNMTDIAAAIGVNQLKKADDFHKARTEIAEIYNKEFADVPGITIPSVKQNVKHSWHLYIIRINDSAGISRNEFIRKLADAGIGTSVHYIPLHLHPYYKENFGYRPDDFPVALKLYSQVISLPVYPAMSQEDIRRVTETVKSILKHAEK